MNVLFTEFVIIFLILNILPTYGLHSLMCNKPNVTCSELDLVKIHWNLNGMHQEDPKLIEAIKETILIPPDQLPLSLLKPSRKRLSGQFNQVAAVEKLLDLNKKKQDPKFFIEAGAGCGEYLSNTLYLELAYNWTGLLVEPNPDLLELLYAKHRNSWVLPHCLSPTPFVQVVNFDVARLLSGIILEGKTKPSRLQRDMTMHPLMDFEREIQVQCFPLYSVLKAMGQPKVDYFSLDIEGAEFAVLNTIPWKDVDIDVLGVEVNHAGDIFDGSRDDIADLLYEHEYKYMGRTKIDDFYMKKNRNETHRTNEEL